MVIRWINVRHGSSLSITSQIALLTDYLQAKEKAQKNRSRVAQDKEKLQHQQRQEVPNSPAIMKMNITCIIMIAQTTLFSCGLLSQAAQARREEKKRLEKEKMMLEDDPEKTRKWEVRSLTRDPWVTGSSWKCLLPPTATRAQETDEEAAEP